MPEMQVAWVITRAVIATVRPPIQTPVSDSTLVRRLEVTIMTVMIHLPSSMNCLVSEIMHVACHLVYVPLKPAVSVIQLVDIPKREVTLPVSAVSVPTHVWRHKAIPFRNVAAEATPHVKSQFRLHFKTTVVSEKRHAKGLRMSPSRKIAASEILLALF